MKEQEFYKEKIIEMVQGIENCDILMYIYKLVCDVIGVENVKKE